MLLSEYVYCVAITFKMTEQVEQHIKFRVKLEYYSTETENGIILSPQLWASVIVSLITTINLLMHNVSCRVHWQNIK